MGLRIMNNDSLGSPFTVTILNCEMLQVNTKFTENIQDRPQMPNFKNKQ